VQSGRAGLRLLFLCCSDDIGEKRMRINETIKSMHNKPIFDTLSELVLFFLFLVLLWLQSVGAKCGKTGFSPSAQICHPYLLVVTVRVRAWMPRMIALWPASGVSLTVATRRIRDSTPRYKSDRTPKHTRSHSLTEISGLWLNVFTQYLFHSNPRSSLSSSLVNTWTSSW